MIRVRRGYILDAHPPTEYNYQWQSVPTQLQRSVTIPVYTQDEDEPAALELTTRDKVFLTERSADLPFDRQTISFFSRTSSGSVEHRIYSEVDSVTGLYRVAYDGGLAAWSKQSQAPVRFSLMAGEERLEQQGTYIINARLFGYFLGSSGWSISEAPGAFGSWVSNQWMLASTDTQTQQEFLYTVSGGVVPSGG